MGKKMKKGARAEYKKFDETFAPLTPGTPEYKETCVQANMYAEYQDSRRRDLLVTLTDLAKNVALPVALAIFAAYLDSKGQIAFKNPIHRLPIKSNGPDLKRKEVFRKK